MMHSSINLVTFLTVISNYCFTEILLYVRLFYNYSWLSLFRILNISNFALSQTIYPVTWSYSTWSKQKTLGISNLDISNFCQTVKMSNRLSGLLSRFLLLSRTFLNVSKTFLAIFLFKLVFFQQPLAQLLQMSWQEWVKTLKSIFFVFFLFDQMFRLNFFITRIFNKTSLWR